MKCRKAVYRVQNNGYKGAQRTQEMNVQIQYELKQRDSKHKKQKQRNHKINSQK